MDDLTFGLTMAVVGMGGTLLTLGIIALLVRGLTSLLPPQEDTGRGKK